MGELIASGSYADVFLGRFNGMPVAIKCYRDQFKEHSVSDCMREAVVLHELDHAHIIKLVHATFTPGDLAIYTAHYSNGNLKDLLRGHSGIRAPLPWAARLRYAHQIATACSYLHKQGFIHRDIKAENILLDENLENALLADFGLVRRQEEACVVDQRADQWFPGSILLPSRKRLIPKQRQLKFISFNEATGMYGTPSHMSPEIFAMEELTERADVYSFGMFLWELLTRESPFPGMDFTAISLHTLSEAKLSRDPSIPPFIPQHLVTNGICCQAYISLMRHSWSRSPSKRPPFEDIAKVLASNECGLRPTEFILN